MSFIWPSMLASLSLLPLCIWLYVVQQRRRRQIATRFGALGLASLAGLRQPGQGFRPGGWLAAGRRRHLPPALFLAGLATLLLSLARPEAALSLPRVEGTLILAFDVSHSMAADDLQPSRMEAAKLAAQEFVRRQPPGVQIGVVAFSDSGIAVQVPTSDQAALLAAIQRLRPRLGTSLGHGILAALNAVAVAAGHEPLSMASPTPQPDRPSQAPLAERAPQTPAVIVLLSDGEHNSDPDPLEAATNAANRGVRIYTIGLGSAQGTTLELEGFSVHTQLDEALLRQIAELTQGAYYPAADEQALRAIYDDVETRLVVSSEKTEVTALFAAAGLLLLLIGGICSLLWFGRMP